MSLRCRVRLFCWFNSLWRWNLSSTPWWNIVIRRPALLGDHPGPSTFIALRLPIFLDGRLKALSKTIIGNVRVGERETTSLLQSDCSLFIKVFEVLLLAEIDTAKKVFSRDFIVILSHRSYFVFSWIFIWISVYIIVMSMSKIVSVSKKRFISNNPPIMVREHPLSVVDAVGEVALTATSRKRNYF